MYVAMNGVGIPRIEMNGLRSIIGGGKEYWD